MDALWQFPPYLWPLIGAEVTALVVALFAWRRRPARGAGLLALLMLAVAEWTALYTLELATRDVSRALLWARTGYLGIVTVPATWLALVLCYTGYEHWLARRRRWLLLAVEPAMTLLLVWTNDLHGLIWSQIQQVSRGPYTLLAITHGTGWWIHSAYSYLLLLLGTILLLRAMFRSPHPYRGQMATLLSGALLPWLTNALYVVGLNPFPPIDLTPFAFTLAGLVMAWGLFRFRLLDLVPIARNVVVDGMTDGVIVLDTQNRIVDLNPAARQIIGRPAAQVIGRPIREIVAGRPDLIEQYHNVPEVQAEISLGTGKGQRIYQMCLSPLYDRRGRFNGRVIVLREITLLRQAEEALRRRDAILEMVAYAADRFLRMPDWEREIPAILASLGEATGVSRVYIFENHRGPKGELLTSQRYEWTAPDAAPQIDNPDLQNFPYLQAGFARWVETMNGGEAVYGLVCTFPESERGILAAQDILSIAVVPVLVGGEWWGFIGLDECRFERTWTPAEIETLQMAANMLGAAIYRSRVHQRLEDQARFLALLHGITRVAIGTTDFQNMLQALADRLGELFCADGCYITLWDEEEERVVPRAAYGPMRETYPNLQFRPGETTATESVLRVGRALAIEDVFNSPYLSPRIAAQFPTRSMLALPLIVGQQRLGAALISFHQPHRFTPEEVARAEYAATQIALAIAKSQALMLSHREIARRKEAEEQLRQHARQLEARNEELDAFAHTVAHDLRHSLSLIVGYAEVLDGFLPELLSEQQREYLQIVIRQGHKMADIIDALLLLATVSRQETETGPLDMGCIVAEALSRLADMISEDCVEILLPPAWPTALGYAPWIEEVWFNYISNAIKYGGQPPRVELGADFPPDAPEMVRFWVRDNGPGLTLEEQSRLFTPATRLKFMGKGHGLGLSIVKRIVEKLGGQVSVESQPGQGSLFAFTLPTAEIQPPGSRQG